MQPDYATTVCTFSILQLEAVLFVFFIILFFHTVDNDSLDHIPKLHIHFIGRLVRDALLLRDYQKLSVAILPVTYFPKETPEMFWKVSVGSTLQCESHN